VATFLSDWSDKYKCYDSIYSNCQRFAYDLFNFLAPNEYLHQVEIASKKLQSPYDRGEAKIELKKKKKEKILSEEQTNKENDEDSSTDSWCDSVDHSTTPEQSKNSRSNDIQKELSKQIFKDTDKTKRKNEEEKKHSELKSSNVNGKKN